MNLQRPLVLETNKQNLTCKQCINANFVTEPSPPKAAWESISCERTLMNMTTEIDARRENYDGPTKRRC